MLMILCWQLLLLFYYYYFLKFHIKQQFNITKLYIMPIAVEDEEYKFYSLYTTIFTRILLYFNLRTINLTLLYRLIPQTIALFLKRVRNLVSLFRPNFIMFAWQQMMQFMTRVKQCLNKINTHIISTTFQSFRITFHQRRRSYNTSRSIIRRARF